jgi:hypothetical protein
MDSSSVAAAVVYRLRRVSNPRLPSTRKELANRLTARAPLRSSLATTREWKYERQDSFRVGELRSTAR